VVAAAMRIGMQGVTGPPVHVVAVPIVPLNQVAYDEMERLSDPSPILNALMVCAETLAPLST